MPTSPFLIAVAETLSFLLQGHTANMINSPCIFKSAHLFRHYAHNPYMIITDYYYVTITECMHYGYNE